MGVFLGIMASLYLMGSQYGIKSATKVAYRGGYSTFLTKLVSMYRYLDTEILNNMYFVEYWLDICLWAII